MEVTIPIDTDRDQHRLAGDHASLAHPLVARVEDQIREGFGQGAAGEFRQTVIQPLVHRTDRGSSKAEGRVLMLALIAANRASPQPSPHCMIKGPRAMAASVPICSATSTGCHKGSRNRQPAGALPHSARNRPSIGVFW